MIAIFREDSRVLGTPEPRRADAANLGEARGGVVRADVPELEQGCRGIRGKECVAVRVPLNGARGILDYFVVPYVASIRVHFRLLGHIVDDEVSFEEEGDIAGVGVAWHVGFAAEILRPIEQLLVDVRLIHGDANDPWSPI